MKNIIALDHVSHPLEVEINWTQVYSDSVSRVFHYFCYKVGDIQLAEDLTAATFEKAWKNRQKYKPSKGLPHAWIIGIARNVSTDHFRRDHREVSMEDLPETSLTVGEEDTLQKRLDFQSILKSLNDYPKRERELITLKYGAELTNRQIAHLTGLSESNVGTILHRVVDKLRTEWEKNHER
jgi:RNA polymerase sigma-70 factor, ECF subfamily